MNGIERITRRIDDNAQADIDKVLREAKDQAAQITLRYQEQAKKDAAAWKNQNEKAAKEREERLISAAEMDARKTALAARQEMVDKAFDAALKKLCSMEPETYTKVTVGLLCKAAPDGKGEVVFSPKDRKAVGKAIVEQANEQLNGKLKLSRETRSIQGGFILVRGSVEINCTFETLVRLEKGESAGEVAKRLFPAPKR